MSKKQFDKFFVANLKRTAQMVSPMVRRKAKLQQEIAERMEEISALDLQISSMDGHIREITGFGVEDLVKRTVIDTGKKDKAGNPVKITKWELKYPETVIPEAQKVSEEDTTLGCIPSDYQVIATEPVAVAEEACDQSFAEIEKEFLD